MTALPAELAKLSIEEKRELIELLWESIDSQIANDNIGEEFDQELQRRSAEARQHPERLIPWDQAKKRIEQHLARLRVRE